MVNIGTILTLRYDPSSNSLIKGDNGSGGVIRNIPPKEISQLRHVFSKDHNNIPSPHDLENEIRHLIKIRIEESKANRIAVALSSGVDSNVIFSLIRKEFPHVDIECLNVTFDEDSSEALRAGQIAESKEAGFHEIHVENPLRDLPMLLSIIKEPRWNVYQYYFIEKARSISNVLFTGDGGDELFAGYSFLFNLDPLALKASLQKLWKAMSFSAVPMAQSLGMAAKIPFLEPEVKKLAIDVDPSFLVVEENGQKWGKWIVRKAFEEMLPSQITWRVKTPIEYGCGTTTLPQVFEKRISDSEFREKQKQIKEVDNVTIRDKEHLVYYEIFHRVFGDRPEITGRTCPQCHYEVRSDATFCRTCGAYPI